MEGYKIKLEPYLWLLSISFLLDSYRMFHRFNNGEKPISPIIWFLSFMFRTLIAVLLLDFLIK